MKSDIDMLSVEHFSTLVLALSMDKTRQLLSFLKSSALPLKSPDLVKLVLQAGFRGVLDIF